MADHGQYTESTRVFKTYRDRSGTGLTRSDVEVFGVISRSKVKTLTTSEISKRAGLSPKSVYNAVSDLERLGYISVTRSHRNANEYEVLRGLK